MAAGDPLSNLSDMINLATGGSSGAPEQVNFCKKAHIGGAAASTAVATISGRITSLWMYDGAPSGASTTAPTTAAVPTNATSGALKQTTSAASTKKRLISIVAVSLVTGSIIVYDRVGHQGGLDGTVTTAQTTNLPTSALTRRTSGVGVEAWAEIYTQIGATGTTATISYTNQAGTSSQTSPAFTFGGTGFREAQRILPLPLASGDYGVRAVANCDLVASTATAGAFGITLAYPIAILPLSVVGVGRLWSATRNTGGPVDLGATSDACIAMALHPNGTTIPEIFGQAFFLEK